MPKCTGCRQEFDASQLEAFNEHNVCAKCLPAALMHEVREIRQVKWNKEVYSNG